MPDKTIRVDFARFSSSGFGLILGSKSRGLRVGDVIAVTDTDADTVEAEVVEMCHDGVRIRVHWDKILHRA